MSVSAVAALTGYSLQQIRNLEGLGAIEPARRAGNGYRQFTACHVRDLRAYRDLAHAVGPVEARRAMTQIRSLQADQALALVSSFHERILQQRAQALAALEALEVIRAEPVTDEDPADTMTISQLAEALGVRTSTLRFWEQVGLVTPERVNLRSASARRYPPPAIREARITAALRAAGYRIPDVHIAITALRNLRHIDRPIDVLQVRVQQIANRAHALLRAGTTLAEIIQSTARHTLTPPEASTTS
jgi:DNA-binding transcriptional MerR regulator